MISINSFPSCGFGNRILYYYNLRQEAYRRDCDFHCVSWDGHQFFEGDMLGKVGVGDSLDFCLGERFYAYDSLPTRDVFKLKEKPKVPESVCAIHFRGTDFHQWNPNAVLGYDYFVLFTDDPNLQTFTTVKDMLSLANINFVDSWGLLSLAVISNPSETIAPENFIFTQDVSSLRSTNSNRGVDREIYINDFSFMSECDYIISSPSTFCISAGFIGKKKKIIHSAEWVTDRANKDDKFWADLLDGGNDDYSIWKLI